VPSFTQSNSALQSDEVVHVWPFPLVPTVSQNVKVRIWPAGSVPTWQPVPVGQPALVVGSHVMVQSISSGMEPPIPSLSWSAQIPDVAAQSESEAQNATQTPRQIDPAAHPPVVHAAPGGSDPAG
jgi:hypothetical protein